MILPTFTAGNPKQLPTDGVRAIKADRTSSNGYTHLMFDRSRIKGKDWAQKHMLEGMNTMSIDELRTLAASWLNPAKLTQIIGASSDGYDQSQRAYVLANESDEIAFTLEGSEDHPIENPCFVIKNWDKGDLAELRINKREIEKSPHFRQGIVIDTYGTETLVIYTKISTVEPMELIIN